MNSGSWACNTYNQSLTVARNNRQSDKVVAVANGDGPPYSRTKIYAVRVSYAADHAHRPPLHGFTAAARSAHGTDRQTDGRTDGHRTVLIRLPHTRSHNKFDTL